MVERESTNGNLMRKRHHLCCNLAISHNSKKTFRMHCGLLTKLLLRLQHLLHKTIHRFNSAKHKGIKNAEIMDLSKNKNRHDNRWFIFGT